MKKTLGLMCGALLFCPALLAATVTGKITGEELRWLSGHSDSGMLASNTFDHAAGLPPTDRWVPGTFAHSTPLLTLTSESGDKVRVPAQLVGATYVASGSFTPEPAPTAAPVCTDAILAAQATVMSRDGSFCIAEKSAHYSATQVPFNQYRPILKLDQSALIEAFKEKPSGTYNGTVSGTLRYGFYVPGSGALSYRNLPVTFSVQLRHVASQLSRISVLGAGHITPQYNTYQHTAQGTTGYKITAYGAFETGIRFRFVSKADDDYSLKAVGVPLATALPYSISCAQCLPDTTLVEDGVLRYPEQWLRVEQSGPSVSFDLKIFYKDVSADDVVDARYQDSFTLMLEAIL
ncbi:hypothetical protein CGH72_08435 [Vibrio parahaemolyticus]|uniref:hypothetical protein n=3 Tax=Vibrio parahaemolyticus TaxID=670 RepID=UPI0005EED945|nr:hypothetical protein [Vibrio parahaemolyticus]TOK04603.1 hypothetical protein CGI25_22275 [Vibrio parahaemolyticus]TOM64744.1 hypothetical protein CGH73_20865 [Vibrio parahaemolyticus]TOM73479.1 hypothetical protein CGH72_08435 [Vibrio parahaemolyticus]TON02632.1 hypothetical protein CGH67_21505 [Vibrio parahaemolyticus]